MPNTGWQQCTGKGEKQRSNSRKHPRCRGRYWHRCQTRTARFFMFPPPCPRPPPSRHIVFVVIGAVALCRWFVSRLWVLQKSK